LLQHLLDLGPGLREGTQGRLLDLGICLEIEGTEHGDRLPSPGDNDLLSGIDALEQSFEVLANLLNRGKLHGAVTS